MATAVGWEEGWQCPTESQGHQGHSAHEGHILGTSSCRGGQVGGPEVPHEGVELLGQQNVGMRMNMTSSLLPEVAGA